MKFDLSRENDRLVQRLENALANDAISHAYIIEGGSNVDKVAFAKAFAKGILCPKRLGENCGECSGCDKIDHGNQEDILYLRKREGRANILVEDVRDMQAELMIRPFGARHIAIIVDGDDLSEICQNTLLKTLEEPPGESLLMILLENTENMLPTIRSRCVLCRIEGSGLGAGDKIRALGEETLEMLSRRAPFYRLKKSADAVAKERDKAIALVDVLEELYGKRFFRRDERDVPYSAEKMKQDLYVIEEARRRLQRGMNIGYTLKEMLLKLAG